MIEIFRHQDYARVGLVQGILEAEGIATILRNRSADAATIGVPAPTMYPNVCVLHDEDAPEAEVLLSIHFKGEASEEAPPWNCKNCDESNEGNFYECWSCQSDRAVIEDLPENTP